MDGLGGGGKRVMEGGRERWLWRGRAVDGGGEGEGMRGTVGWQRKEGVMNGGNGGEGIKDEECGGEAAREG